MQLVELQTQPQRIGKKGLNMKFQKMWIGMLAAWFAVWGATARGALEHATVLSHQGEWEVVQTDAGPTKAVFLVSRESDSRTQLASVEVSAETATNVYWDAFAGVDAQTGAPVGGMVTNVETIATPFEFNAFVNAGSVYWVDWEDGVPRLWTAPCHAPEMKSLLATGAAGTPLGSRSFLAQPWNHGATWMEEGPAGPERVVFENGKIVRLASGILDAPREVALRRVAGNTRKGTKSSGPWSIKDYETDHGYKSSGKWKPPSWNWKIEWRSPFAGAQTVEIPDGVTKIGRYVFSECSELENVTGGKNVKKIGDGAFYNCTSLTNVTIPSRVTNIGSRTFELCSALPSVAIPNGVKNIGASAFANCSGLTSVAIPGSVTNIGSEAFAWCESLASMTIPNGVKNIGNNAFYWCSGLTNLTIANGVKSIGERAFYYCNGLTDVAIPASVSRIGERAFSQCNALKSFQVASGNSSYMAVDGVLYTKDGKKLLCFPKGKTGSFTVPATVTSIGDAAFENCYSLTGVAMSEGVKSIGENAFNYCSGLTAVTLPGSVTRIGRGAFAWCSSLPSVTIPNGVKNILPWTFEGCSGLTSVTIPGSVTNIGDYAFYWCRSLENLTIPDTVKGIGRWAFGYCDGLKTLYVPVAWKSKMHYWSSGGISKKMLWSKYAEVPEDCEIVYLDPKQWVTFDANGGTCETHSKTCEVGKTYGELPAATSSKGVLAGWFTAKTGGTKVTASSKVPNKTARTLYAHWTTTQTLTYNANGGKCSTKSKKVTMGKKYGALATATKAGVGFAGWGDAPEGGVPVTADDVVPVAVSRTVYAQWTTNQNVMFDANGGSTKTPEWTYTIGGTYGSLPGATSSTGVLEGWYTAKKGGTKVTAASKVTDAASRTLYAHWTTAQTLTYNANGGKCSTKSKKVTIGKKYGALATATKAGVGFAGWGDAPEGGVPVTADDVVTAEAARTVYAQWTTEQAVTFDANGGNTKMPAGKYAIGGTYGSLPAATKAGAALVGWFTAKKDGTKVTAASKVTEKATRTLYAHWTTTQTLTYNANGGKCSTKSKKCTIGKKYGTLATATRAGFGFVGWRDAPDGGVPVTAADVGTEASARTLYAEWTTNQVVTFDPNGGSIKTPEETYTIGATYGNLPTATKAGSALAGWFTAKKDGTKVTLTSKVTEKASRTLYAHWTTTQTVTFNANGGKCSTKSKKYTVGKTYASLPTATWSGHVFWGWVTEDGKAVAVGSAVPELAARTLYAQWDGAPKPKEPAEIRGLAFGGSGGEHSQSEVGTCVLSLEEEEGVTYEVQWTEDLGGAWTALQRWTAAGDGAREVEIQMPPEPATGFLRVTVSGE